MLKLVRSTKHGVALLSTALKPEAKAIARYGSSGARASLAPPKLPSLVFFKNS